MESLRRLTSSVFDGKIGKKTPVHSPVSTPTSSSANLLQAQTNTAVASGLDVTFISDRLMVMGFPVQGPTNRKNNQNNIDDLAKYLDSQFANQYLIFNLNALDDNVTTTSTPLSPSNGAKTSVTHAIAAKVRDQMLEFSWERDGMKAHTPPLDLIFRICYAIFAWLSLDPAHVACINCQSGRTRSGVVVACYLLYARLADHPTDAFVEFYQKRWDMKNLTAHYLRKKTPPSIQRFLSSFHQLIEQQTAPNEKPLLLKAIIFRALPVDLQPCIQIWDDYKMIYCSETATATTSNRSTDAASLPVIDWNADDGFLGILWENGIDLDGGFSILCSFGDEYHDQQQADEGVDPSSRVLFRYADSTWFLSPGLMTLKKTDMDMMKQYEYGFDDEQFSMDLVLHESTKPRRNYVQIDYTGNEAVRQGLVEITKHHFVLPDPAMHSNFIRMGFSETATTFALQRSQNAPNVALDLLHSEGLTACFPQDPRVVASLEKEQQAGEATMHSDASTAPVRRQTTAEIVAMQSQRSRYSIPTATDAAVCQVCKEDDYMMRPQVVKCTGKCGHSYHTTCVGLKKIPFGLTTLNDRTNHAVYVKKYFSAWECDRCAPPPPTETTMPASPTYPVQNNSILSSSAVEASAPTPPAARAETESPDNLEKLKQFLAVSGISVDDLLRAATTPNISIPSPTPIVESNSQTYDFSAVVTPAKVEQTTDSTAAVASNATPKENKGPLQRSDTAPANVEQEASVQSVGNEHVKVESDVPSTQHQAPPQETAKPKPMDFSSQLMKEIHATKKQDDDQLSLNPTAQLMNEIKARNKTQNTSPPKLDLSAQLMKEIKAAKKETEEDAAEATTQVDKASVAMDKYNMMLKRGVPFEAVQNCMKKDGVDPSLLQPLPESTKKETSPIPPPAPSAKRLQEVEEYAPYFRMLRMGCQKEAVRQKLLMDGMDPIILDLGPDAVYDDVKAKLSKPNDSAATERSNLLNDIRDVKDLRKKSASSDQKEASTVKSPTKPEALASPPTEQIKTPDARPKADDGVLLKDHELYAKYFKMLKMGLPEGAVQHKMKQDGVDERALELGPDAPASALEQPRQPTGVCLKDDPVYGQYFKMLKIGLPEGAVRQKMLKDNANTKALDLGPDALVSELEKLEDIKLKDHPMFTKYFTMLKVGLPEPAVRHKMQQDSVDVRALELGPDASFLRLKELQDGKPAKKAAPIKRRRKKLHWQPIPEDRLNSINQQTIWEEKDEAAIQFEMDMDELESLFFANADANAKKKTASQAKTLKRKQTVTLIDGKRAMNAGIALARVKLSYSEISNAVLHLNPSGLTLEQLVGINECLPTMEEVTIVKRYNGDLSLLGEAEKFMLEISKVHRYGPRMECMIFKLAFPSRSNELLTSLTNLTGACEEVKGSRLLKILLGMVLKLGNTLNGSGHDNEIRGFTVDSLLRLGHTKAVNQKTTVLHYLVRIIKKNHPQVLDFSDELRQVPMAARESFDSIQEDFTKLQSGLARLSDELELVEQNAEADAVAQGLRTSVEEIGNALQRLEQTIQDARDQVASVLEYFGEDPTKNASEFFTTLASFCRAFDAARKQVDAEDEAALRAERVKMRRSASMARPPMKPGASLLTNRVRVERAMSERPPSPTKRHSSSAL